MSPVQGIRRFRRRLAYLAGGLACFGVAVFATTANDRVLGKAGDFERLVRAPFGAPVYVGNLESTALDETSGLAASRLQDDLLWAINDSGNDPVLHAIGADGRDRGSVFVEGAENRDWEDIASFLWKDEESGRTRSYLLVADTGDNLSRHKTLSLYAIAEPALAGERFPAGSVARVAWRLKFRFEDGPRDAEGIAVDLAGRQILIVSKRNVPAEVYSLELPKALLEPKTASTASSHEGPAGRAPSDDTAVATRIALLGAIPQPTEADLEENPKYGAHRSQPTAFDISPNGRDAVILTYKHAYYYSRATGESWQQALAHEPKRLAIPPMRQPEAGAFARDGASFFATTEDRPAPLFQLPRN